MNKLVNLVKRFILRKQLRHCLRKQIILGERIEKIHQNILDLICNGDEKTTIELLRLERDELCDARLRLIDKKYEIKDQLRRVS